MVYNSKKIEKSVLQGSNKIVKVSYLHALWYYYLLFMLQIT